MRRPAILVVLLVLGLAGCRAQRTLTIVSTPPGALVRLDDLLVGKTPVTLPFKDYGTRRLTLSKEGHLTITRQIDLVAPWYGRFPIDIFSEVLLPIGWEDHHEVDLELPPGDDVVAEPDLRSVLERAEALRRAGPDGPRELPPVRLVPARRRDALDSPDSDSPDPDEP